LAWQRKHRVDEIVARRARATHLNR
jgi:hypothetical protein